MAWRGEAGAVAEAPAEGGLHVRLRQEGPIPLAAEFRCAAGELLALVGPSGSGKTTILRAIAGLYRAAEAEIRCAGQLWQDRGRGIFVPPQARRVGLVFQDYALFPHMSAADNVAAALGHLPRRRRREKAGELLALVHLAGLEGRRPAELSGGQRQRVALARALARDPAALLLDEPFSAVDQVTRRKLQRELASLRGGLGIPILLVTHDLDEAAALADRMVVLHRGRSLQQAPPFELLSRPGSAEVARLVGLRNLFEGEVAAAPPAPGLTGLRWGPYLLEVRHAAGFAPGARVRWLVPPGSVVLHRRDRPSRGERENPLHGIVVEFLRLGDTVHLGMTVTGCEAAPLNFTVPAHVAERNNLAAGERIGVSLLAEGIHLMPWHSDSEAP